MKETMLNLFKNIFKTDSQTKISHLESALKAFENQNYRLIRENEILRDKLIRYKARDAKGRFATVEIRHEN